MWAHNRLTNPPICVLGSHTAGANGVIFNRFAWADALGRCSNVYTAGQLLGIVLPQHQRYRRNGWNMAVWSNFSYPWQSPPPSTGQCPTLSLRAGQIVELLAQGNFVLNFPGGTIPGQQVFASTTDGSPWTGVSGGGYVPTQWTTLGGTGVNGNALVSSYVPPF